MHANAAATQAMPISGMSETSVHTAAFTRQSVTAKISVMTLPTASAATFSCEMAVAMSVARAPVNSSRHAALP